jgi:hypothetical protein
MNTSYIVSQVLRDLNKYADAGLITEDELYSDAISELKRFGNDICVIQEGFVDVRNGYGKLPDQFFSLRLALECEPHYYQRKNVEIHDIQHSLFYKERAVVGNTWNECESCCQEQTENIVRETVYMNAGSIDYYYKNSRPLRLTKTMEKSVCTSSCMNRYVNDNPHEINILKRNTIQANFNTGTIYIQYYGLPVDEEGYIDVPDTANGHLNKYIEYYLKRRCAERLIGNSDAQGIQTLYPIYAQQESTALRNASSELKLSKLTPKDFRKMQMKNRLDVLNYEINLPRWLH